VGDLPNVTLELLRRGYNADQIEGVLGENLLRVLAAAERAKAARAPSSAEP
jgi:microsomal dipeptidase-like Zn-dependent dipeptidase